MPRPCNVTREQLEAIWADGYHAGRSDRYARKIGIYERNPYNPLSKGRGDEQQVTR